MKAFKLKNYTFKLTEYFNIDTKSDNDVIYINLPGRFYSITSVNFRLWRTNDAIDYIIKKYLE